MVEFMQQETRIMSQVYCKTVKKLSSAIQNKRRGMLTCGVVLLHDNAHLHTATHNQALMEHLNWGVTDYLPHNADLAPSEYHLFIYLKNWLQSQCFSINEMMEGVKMWLYPQVVSFFDTGTQ
jgi:hypothetical protein